MKEGDRVILKEFKNGIDGLHFTNYMQEELGKEVVVSEVDNSDNTFLIEGSY